MSPLERLDWLRRVRDAGATLSAMSVAVEVAYRDSGDGAWGSLGGAAIGDRAARDGRAWLVANGFLRRIHRAWQAMVPSGTTVPESGIVEPERHDGAGFRHDGAGGEHRHDSAGFRHDDAGRDEDQQTGSGTTVPPDRHHGAEKAEPWCHRTGKEPGQNIDTPPPSSSVDQPGSDPATAATPSLSPEEVNRRLSTRVDGSADLGAARHALLGCDPLGLLNAFRVNMPGREGDWLRDAGGMQIGVLAAILLWRRSVCDAVREPSGLRHAREAWARLDPAFRQAWGEAVQRLITGEPP